MNQKLTSKTRISGNQSHASLPLVDQIGNSRRPDRLLEQAAAPTQTPHGMTVAPGQHAAKAYMGIAGHMPARQVAQPLSPKVYGPVNTMHQAQCPHCGQPMPGMTGMHGLPTPYAAL